MRSGERGRLVVDRCNVDRSVYAVVRDPEWLGVVAIY
jgi:hypothetical protein